MEDDRKFYNAPESLNEIRAHKEQDGRKWQPRDALIQLLREIDAGELDPDLLVMIWRTTSGESTNCLYSVSGPKARFYDVVGLIERAKHFIMQG